MPFEFNKVTITDDYYKTVEMGAKGMYVSSSPSANTVAFYKSQGFELAKEVNKELYDLELEDIHMIKILYGKATKRTKTILGL